MKGWSKLRRDAAAQQRAPLRPGDTVSFLADIYLSANGGWPVNIQPGDFGVAKWKHRDNRRWAVEVKPPVGFDVARVGSQGFNVTVFRRYLERVTDEEAAALALAR